MVTISLEELIVTVLVTCSCNKIVLLMIHSIDSVTSLNIVKAKRCVESINIVVSAALAQIAKSC